MRTTGRADGRSGASGRARSAGSAAAPPRNRPLTREDVLSAALGIVDQDGVGALSMRRLAQVLQRDPMAPYRHAANKAALLDGMTELVLRQLVVEPSGEPWEVQLRAIARRFRQLALAHPNVVPLLVTRPLATPLGLRPLGTLRPLEGILELLIRAGFTPDGALSTYRALVGFLYGHVLNELQEIVDDPEETDDLLRLGLYRLPAREFPRLRSLASALATYDGAAELEHGLDILLGGMRTRYAPRELAPRELAPRELAPRELAPRELAPRELAPRELAPANPPGQ